MIERPTPPPPRYVTHGSLALFCVAAIVVIGLCWWGLYEIGHPEAVWLFHLIGVGRG